ncbi:MAG: hypothetical protein WBG17_01020 [Burkholderiaceae bacterium]
MTVVNISFPTRRAWRRLPLVSALLVSALLASPASATPQPEASVAALDLSLPRGEAERQRVPRPELAPTPPSEFAEWEKPQRPMPWQQPMNLQSNPICGNGQHGIPYPGLQGRQMYRCE